jgi:Domain of unknown function (DUF4785) C-terminal domain
VRTRGQRRIITGAAAVGLIAALALFLRPAAGTRGAVDPAPAPPVISRTAGTPPPPMPAPSAAPQAAGGGPGPDAFAPEALARRAAAEYRRRARYPRSSRPLDDGPDPLERDREVSRIAQRGPGGEEPALTVYPLAAGFEDPEPAVLYAYLSVDGRRIPARAIRGTIVTEDLAPIGEIEYRDDGARGDAVAHDRVYTAVFLPSPEAVPALGRSYMVQVVATTRRDDERRAATSFLYSHPHAQLTGRYRDAVVKGSLEVGVEVEVAEAGRFHVEATLYGPDGTRKVAWAQAAGELEPGRQWMAIPFYGLILRERGIAGPYLVRWVALSTTTQMPNAKNRLSEANYRTAAYDLGAFTDQPFNDADLLDAATRLDHDRTELGGLDKGG